jgi:hypothetical protein
MAAFPALEPAERTYTAATYPLTIQTGWGSGSVRFSHGTTPTGYLLKLGYPLLTAAEAGQIRTHYRGQRGGALPFALDAAVWLGHGGDTAPATAGTLWRYASPPEETHRSGGLIDVSVELESLI